LEETENTSPISLQLSRKRPILSSNLHSFNLTKFMSSDNTSEEQRHPTATYCSFPTSNSHEKSQKPLSFKASAKRRATQFRVIAMQFNRCLVLHIAAWTKARALNPDGRQHERWTCAVSPCTQLHQNIYRWQRCHKVNIFTIT
jgi:hypothetical protein